MTVLLPLSQFTCLLSFSCLITVARTFNIMLNKSGESGHSCLIPDLSRKAFSFYLLSMMLSVGLSYMAFIMLRCAPSILTLLSIFYFFFVINECTLTNAFSTSRDMIMGLLSFVYVVYYIYWFVNIVPSLHPWDESDFIMVYDLFNVLLDLDCQYFVEDFSIYVHQRY